jgi:hypothetical protein
VTEGHAKLVLTCHVPWIGCSNFKTNRNCTQEFQDFIKTTACPKSVKVACGRVKNRCLQKNVPREPAFQMQTVNCDTFLKDLDPQTQLTSSPLQEHQEFIRQTMMSWTATSDSTVTGPNPLLETQLFHDLGQKVAHLCFLRPVQCHKEADLVPDLLCRLSS